MSRPIAFLVLFAAAAAAHAQTVYQCRRDDVLVFQDRACGAGQVVRELAPPAPGEVAPGIADMVADFEQRAAARRGGEPGARKRSSRSSSAPRRAAAVSHRCVAASGAVFYRHGACPARIARRGSPPPAGGRDDAGEAVADETVPRAEACREIARAGAISRAGHEHDARTDTYERNLGRDPCR